MRAKTSRDEVNTKRRSKVVSAKTYDKGGWKLDKLKAWRSDMESTRFDGFVEDLSVYIVLCSILYHKTQQMKRGGKALTCMEEHGNGVKRLAAIPSVVRTSVESSFFREAANTPMPTINTTVTMVYHAHRLFSVSQHPLQSILGLG